MRQQLVTRQTQNLTLTPELKQSLRFLGLATNELVEELKDIKDGDTYIVLTKKDGLVYKRLYNTLDADGTIQFHSDNKAYLPYHIRAEEIFELWHFVCSINPSDTQMTDLIYTAIQDIQTNLANMRLTAAR